MRFLQGSCRDALNRGLNILFSGDKSIRVHRLCEVAPLGETQGSNSGGNNVEVCVQAGVPDVSALEIQHYAFRAANVMTTSLYPISPLRAPGRRL